VPVVAMVMTLFHGVLKLRQMLTLYHANSPTKAAR